MSYYNYGERFPLRGRSCSAEQIPEIKEKFESYNIFASANLETVYGTDEIASALSLKATNFSSGVFLNNGDLVFEFIPFPNEAQVSSINAIRVIDVNADQIPDLLTSGNLYTSEIETTRNDAGIGNILIGNGDGTFNALERSIYLDKDSKDLEFLTVKGATFILSANNDDVLQVFKKLKPIP